MKRNSSLIVMFLVFAFAFVLVGCTQESVDLKKTRLVAAENMALKKEVAKCDAENSTLKKEVEKRDKVTAENLTLKKEIEKRDKEIADNIPLKKEIEKCDKVIADNVSLRKELTKRDNEIADRDARIAAFNKQLDEQKASLAQCQLAVKAWQEETDSKLQERVNNVLKTVTEQNIELRQEVETLKSKLPQSQKPQPDTSAGSNK